MKELGGRQLGPSKQWRLLGGLPCPLLPATGVTLVSLVPVPQLQRSGMLPDPKNTHIVVSWMIAQTVTLVAGLTSLFTLIVPPCNH
ncbi:hypothetical protein AAFF_G00312260 [Aldrovandia affinis]|uniref:Uncharacterized protein n=1 Tax=Aldrovandia affinis TaxID=143900 RepID=A0AAD7SN79_9TELE|nr:hypothetical protein AAFF_G00312260 [Aldrovandia affinis]